MDSVDDIFCLENDESYEKTCGQILLTSKRRIAVHCILCDMIFNSFDAFITHYYEEHLTRKSSDIEIDFEETEVVELLEDESNEMEEGSLTTVKLEINRLHSDVLQEEEFPMSLLEDSEKDTVSLTPRPMKKQESQEEFVDEEFVIPAVVRNVKKRTLWKSWKSPPPDEERKHKCPICGLAFKEKHNMRYHFRRHSNEKNFECPDCGKKFYTLSEVKVHSQFHSGERDFLCSDCGRSFMTNSQLVNHIKRHKNQRDFQCKICDKAFFDSKTLKGHMYVHSKEKPFTCEICSNTFSRPLALSNHMKLHANKKEYKCNICGAAFNQHAGLFSHMKVTHKKS